MHRTIMILVISTFSLGAAADTLSDLRKTLDRFPAKAPFAARATVRTNAAADDAGRGGTSSFDVELSPSGLSVLVPPSALDAAQREASQKKRDPNVTTPTRTAMVALTIFDIIDAVDAASMLGDDLSEASVIEEKTDVWQGKPAKLLRVKVKPSLATKSRYVEEPVIELTIWIGNDGIPLAARRVSTFEAGALFVKAGNIRTEKWTFAVAADRLYATRNEQEDSASAAGKKMTRSRTVSYLVKRSASGDAATTTNAFDGESAREGGFDTFLADVMPSAVILMMIAVVWGVAGWMV